MTTFETLSLLGQFSITLIAMLTLIVTIVVLLNKKSNRHQWYRLLLRKT